MTRANLKCSCCLIHGSGRKSLLLGFIERALFHTAITTEAVYWIPTIPIPYPILNLYLY